MAATELAAAGGHTRLPEPHPPQQQHLHYHHQRQRRDSRGENIDDAHSVNDHDHDGDQDDLDGDLDDGQDLDPNAKPRKKRRLVKNNDKKFECPHPDCGKSYSRAEHLYRHQLNHTPKEIYRCDFAGCDRSFVRSDLCTRHRERHTAKGSHLQRKDAFLSSRRSIVPPPAGPPDMKDGHLIAHARAHSHAHSHPNPPTTSSNGYHYRSTSDGYPSPARPVQPFAHPQSAHPPNPDGVLPDVPPPAADSRTSYDPNRGSFSAHQPVMNGAGHRMSVSQPPAVNENRSNFNGLVMGQPPPPPNPPYQQPASAPVNSIPPLPIPSPTSGRPLYNSRHFPSPSSTNTLASTPTQSSRPSHSYTSLAPIQSYTYSQPYAVPSLSATMGNSRQGSVAATPILGVSEQPVASGRTNGIVDFAMMDPMNSSYSMPVFGLEAPFIRSPSTAVDENLLNYLFSSAGMDLNDPSPPEISETSQSMDTLPFPLPKMEVESGASERASTTPSDYLDIDSPESRITYKEQARMMRLVQRFEDPKHNMGHWKKSEILAGNFDDPEHCMSMRSLSTYLASYWMHMHQQMPILHRPTFNPGTCPDLLLLAMMCLGIACLERTSSGTFPPAPVELSFFAAHHIRWEAFKETEFRPPAMLWTFQTMLLLELFEKMYSTRDLHERAHIHHATTLTVMRRGSSLTGRSANELLGREDPTRTPPGPDGSINTAGQNTADPWWNRWITAEATRRTAFAAFIIDSTHSILFGHSAVMSPHDLRLPLPSDESQWSAGSGDEVKRIESSLANNGFKPIMFLEGLRRTLNGQKVRTNTFGRTVLMAGLLNVSWHMTQRDLQVSSLGAATTLGNQARWRGPLTRAFDHWKRDFDDSLTKNEQWLAACGLVLPHAAGAGAAERGSPEHRDNVFEARTCLHSLAHMAMHVDIVDCQVFAGAAHALGRAVTAGDRDVVQRRMRDEWAPSARARDSVFYALRFLCEVLIPCEVLDPHSDLSNASRRGTHHVDPHLNDLHHSVHRHHYTSSQSNRPSGLAIAASTTNLTYTARDDYLLNRPWVLYFATLIVWAYGYARDGPLRHPAAGGPSAATADSLLPTHRDRVKHMQDFLIRMGRVATPDDLEKQTDRNACLGLLLLLRQRFEQPRWELLREAADSLNNCMQLLLPTSNGMPMTAR